MIVNLLRKDTLSFITLPDKAKGQFWLIDNDEFNKPRNLISIEAEEDIWVIKSNKTSWLIDDNGKHVEKATLTSMSLYDIKMDGTSDKASIFAEPVSDDRQIMQKVLVTSACDLSIGRSLQHNISYSNDFISESDGRGHAKLRYDGKWWFISDLNSDNGIYVNGERVSSRQLEVGDLIYIMGLRIIVGKSLFAINNPEGKVMVNSGSFQPYIPQIIEKSSPYEDAPVDEFFYRSPRFKREFNRIEISVDAPPSMPQTEHVPLALMLGPSLTMSLASISMGIMTVANVSANNGNIRQALPTLIMSVSMLFGTLLWPPLAKRYDKKQKGLAEKKRQEGYLAYLDSVRDDILRKCKEQSDILSENLISVEDCVNRISEKKRTLWERIVGHDDFLYLRLGCGNMELNADIKYPEKKFAIERDSLMDALHSLGSEQKVLKNVPIGVSFVENYITGIVGPRSSSLGLIYNLLIQTMALHSYDELKIVFIIDKEAAEEWAFAKWLPHTWDNEKVIRYLATSIDEVKELSGVLERSILWVQDDESNANGNSSTYYLIIATNKELAIKCDSLKRLIACKENRGFSIITLYDDIKNIPKETHCVIDLNGNEASIYDKDDLSGKSQTFSPEMSSLSVIKRMAQMVANISLDLYEQHFALPDMMSFLEMFGVSKIEHLNPLTRWKENNPSLSLQTPIGVDVFGEPFILDLHENLHGPHGLVAGTTGAGKSEFIMTYVLSLAVNYHPDEVAFLLIDYKGGGLTGAFEFVYGDNIIKLPHLAGTITNLDGAAIKRAMVAIESESKRRQGVFNKAKAISGEGTMDIYMYQRLYREKVVDKPMPHLFIISDEFAELKSQQPDFMDRLISTARVGRSLGIHLILATQKPAGVVDDQIWSNSRFRVCLKVQEKADSLDMLKRPDAAEITQTGRFYLQVGFNEIFTMGQSAWSGADYIPTETVEKKVDSSVCVIDSLGRVIREAKPVSKSDASIKHPTQLVSLIRYLSELAIEENIGERQLWEKPIPAFIYVDELEAQYAYKASNFILNPLIGKFDDPYNQRQAPLTMPLSSEGNCVIYGAAGTGKTTLLTTMIYSLIKHHGADEVNIYAIDFGAETLTIFNEAPQIGGVILAHELERIANFFKMLLQEFNRRRKALSSYGGDIHKFNKNSGQTMPNIIIIINNYAAFSEQCEIYEEEVALLSRDGLRYGIIFIVTANNTMALRWRIQQNFKQTITMQLNDESHYSVILGKTGGIIPSAYKGRGLICLERVYEFQTAYATDKEDEGSFLRKLALEKQARTQHFAKPVPMMPELVTADLFNKVPITPEAVPVGIAKESLEPAWYDFSTKPIHPILANEISVIARFAQGLCENLLKICNDIIVFDSDMICPNDSTPLYRYYQTDFDQATLEHFTDFMYRHDSYKKARKLGEALPTFETKFIVIIGLKKLFDSVTNESANSIKEMLARTEASYKICFIIAEPVQSFKDLWDHEWYKAYVPGIGGIWIGDGFANQSIFDPVYRPYESIGDDFGYVYQKGKLTLAKLLTV